MCILNEGAYMVKISIAIQKGGVGKTTTAVNLAHGLSMKGKKVVLVDCDPQGNCSSNYIAELPLHELANVLQGEATVKEALVPIRDNLFIIPTYSVNGSLRNYGDTKINQEPYIFQDLAEELKKENFDYVIYDLSPGFSGLERAVLLGSDEVITPLLPEAFSFGGIESFTHDLDKLRKQMRHRIKYNKLILNNVNMSLKEHKNNVAEIIDSLPEEMNTFIIPTDTRIKEAQSHKKSIFEYKRDNDRSNTPSRSVDAFNKLVEAL